MNMEGWTLNGGSMATTGQGLTINATNITGSYTGVSFSPGDWTQVIDMKDQMIKMQLQGIIKKELETVDLDIDNLNKLLGGSQEDRLVAIELLKGQTRYTGRILELYIQGYNSYESIIWEINSNNNFVHLSKDWQ